MKLFQCEINRIKVVFFREPVNLCKKLSEFSCLNVTSDFIIDAFQTYERGEDFFDQYLEKERGN